MVAPFMLMTCMIVIGSEGGPALKTMDLVENAACYFDVDVKIIEVVKRTDQGDVTILPIVGIPPAARRIQSGDMVKACEPVGLAGGTISGRDDLWPSLVEVGIQVEIVKGAKRKRCR